MNTKEKLVKIKKVLKNIKKLKVISVKKYQATLKEIEKKQVN